jgi:predicted HAD superfamily hydrolase/glycosyltransferase involved in cell wall biosynthesis/GT2 family glycosyltransferase
MNTLYFARANLNLCEKNYELAIRQYELLLVDYAGTPLETHIQFNLDLALRYFQKFSLASLSGDNNVFDIGLGQLSDLDLLENSKFFDATYYNNRYSDVVNYGDGPAEHYLRFGAFERRDPGPNFSSSYYYFMHDDVRSAELNPLIHYLRFGQNEGRDIQSADWKEPEPSFVKEPISRYEAWNTVNQLSANRTRALQHGLAIGGNKQHLIKTLSPVGIEKDFLIALAEVDAVSFDIFDTLLARNVSDPIDIFYIVEAKVQKHGLYNGRFAQERIQAELNARKHSAYEEVTLSEIYHEFSCITGVDEKLSIEISRLEIDVELENIKPRQLGIRMFQRSILAGKKTSLISDFYMSLDVVIRMLEICGVSGFEHIFISCEHRLTKHAGSLFKKYQNLFTTDFRLLHVGDNIHSDGEMAERNGLKSFTVPKLIFRPEVDAIVSKFWKSEGVKENINRDLVKSAIIAITSSKIDALIDLHSEQSRGYDESPYLLGFTVFGPLFAGMASYIAKVAKQQNHKKLFFASRDGYYLMAAYEHLTRHNAELPKAHYFFSSRILANASSIENLEDIQRIASVDFSKCRLKDLLAYRFGVNADDLAKLPKRALMDCGFTSPDEFIEHGKHLNGLLKFVKSLKAIIIEKNTAVRENYIGYLKQIGMGSQKSAIVDIGYSGTIQMAMSRLLKQNIDGIYFITWKRAEQIERAGLSFEAFLGKCVGDGHQFNSYIQLFELIFSATHPSVIGIEKVAISEYSPQYSKHTFPSKVLNMLAELRRGAMDFVDEFSRTVSTKFDVFSVMQEADFVAPAFKFFENPSPLAASYFKDVIFEDDFGGQRKSLINNMWRAQPIDIKHSISDSLWTEGARAILVNQKYAHMPTSAINHDSNVTHYTGDHAPVDDFSHDGLIPSYSVPNPAIKDMATISSRPLIFCILLQVESTEVNRIDTFIQSLVHQSYGQWQLQVIVDAASREVESVIQKWKVLLPSNEIYVIARSEETINPLASLTDTDWCIFASTNVIFSQDLFAEIILEIQNGNVDFIYTDHAERHSKNKKDSLIFKPSWSPELLKGQQYIGEFYAVNIAFTLRSQVSLITPPSLSHILHLAELSPKVRHIPRVLWSRVEVNFDSSTSNKDMAAIQKSFRLEGIDCLIKENGTYNHLKSYSPIFQDNGPSVAIIIPTKNAVNVLSTCLDSLDKTTYKNYKVYVVDNDSDSPDAIDYLKRSRHTVLRISSPSSGFNYSNLNNSAVKEINEDYLLFLNNDTEVITPEWLSQMMGWARLDGVGSVGARLIYQNGKIQHAGLVNGLLGGILPAPAFKLLDGNDPGYLGHAKVSKNYSAMTAACMLTPRKLFVNFGGFNETEFGVAYNDCDYGFRLTLAGYRNVYCAEAELYHYEGYTRGIGIGNDKPAEEAACVRLYGDWVDPYYNPNLERDKTEFELSSRTTAYKNIPRVRLLFVTHNLNMEGAPIILCEIACGIALSNEFEVVILSPSDGPLKLKYEESGVEVHVLKSHPIFGSRNPNDYNLAIRDLSFLIEKLRIEVVFANTVLAWWAIDAASESNLPSVWCIHESESPFSHFDEHGIFLKNNARRCLSYPYQVVFVANATKKLFEPLADQRNLVVIHNGFNSDRLNEQIENLTKTNVRKELNILEDDIVLLSVGTVCERKNQIELVKGLSELPEDVQKRVKIFIVGDRQSSYSEELRDEILNLPPTYAKRIILVPETKDVGRYYLAADIFVLTSKLESFPIVIQEAMHFGLAIVANPSFGIREQLNGEVSALFYQLGDVKNLSKQILRLVNSQELRRSLGRNAQISLGKLPSGATMISKHLEIIKEAWLFGSPRVKVLIDESYQVFD